MPTALAPTVAKRNSPNVAWTRPEYTDLLPRWNLIRDCIAGAAQVKKRGTDYLPKPNPTDLSAENAARYLQYLQRAVFYGVTGRTLQGLVGQVMSEDPIFKLPDIIAMMEDDMDGGGVSFVQQANKVLALVTAHGRAGLLIDYPHVNGVTTQADLDAGYIRPTIQIVEPWDIINWRVQHVGGKAKLSSVVISEMYVTDDDGFQQLWDPQWRVLKLDEDGLCVVQEWIKDPQNENEFILKPIQSAESDTEQNGVAEYMPTDSKGQRLDYIPFAFVGAINNDPTPDLPPLYDLAQLNIAHYCNSADYEESCFLVGQPTPVLTGLTEDWVNTVLKGQIQLGSRGSISLPVGGDAKLLQASENSMPKEAMKDKEAQMVALGAKLVQQQNVQRTATEVTADKAAETSSLAMIASNVSEAFECALCCALAFVDVSQVPEDDEGDNEVIEVELNTNFVANRMNAQERAQLVAEWQAGAITDEEMRRNMVRAGVADEDFNAWKQAQADQALTKPIMAQPSAMPGIDPATGKPMQQPPRNMPPAKPGMKSGAADQ